MPTFLCFIFIDLNFISNAHTKGTFFMEKEAEKNSLELSCVGTHKNQDKWLPCENEKESHRYLRM